MFIHELAAQTGVPTKTIRYYESIGLLPPARRAVNNYRQYTVADVERLRFIASARSLGFSPDDIASIDVEGNHENLACKLGALGALRNAGSQKRSQVAFRHFQRHECQCAVDSNLNALVLR